jgi:hypothetical protein
MTRTEQIYKQIEYVRYIQRTTQDVEFRKAYDSTIDNLEILISMIDPENENDEIIDEKVYQQHIQEQLDTMNDLDNSQI